MTGRVEAKSAVEKIVNNLFIKSMKTAELFPTVVLNVNTFLVHDTQLQFDFLPEEIMHK